MTNKPAQNNTPANSSSPLGELEGAYHTPVLLHKSVEALNIKPNGNYVDVTFGGGGHSALIVEQLEQGKLFAFDHDNDAINNIKEDERFIFVNHNFRFLKKFMRWHNAIPVDGILADLGVSSHQFDVGERGFSIRFDGPLDMRMNQEGELSAADVLNNYNAKNLLKIFSEYGEVRNAKRLVSEIEKARQTRPFNQINDLMVILENTAFGNKEKYKAQVFQALRIEVNDEMGALKDMLEQATDILKPGGRLVVLTYHSLEDRLVKNIMKTGNIEGKLIVNEYGVTQTPYKQINRKPIMADEQEIKQNPRARSAKLRIAEKKPIQAYPKERS